MRVAELHGLIDRDTLSGDVSRPGEGDDGPREKPDQDDRDEEAGFRPDVGTWVEDLTHQARRPLGVKVLMM
jgi:hypothetical protein